MVGAGELEDGSRPVAARARRMAVIAASVPEEVIRSISTPGIRRETSSPARPRPRSGRRSWFRGRRRVDRRQHLRVGVAVDQRAPRADVVDEAVAVDVDQLGAVAALDEDRVAADRPASPAPAS